ncbi:MAG: DUF3703 domain-containing protein [Bacteroidetes bacterium]|nr:DUF3703 domain-containing protein [Bacteroidota bacterium]
MKVKHSIVLKAAQYEVWSQLLKPGLLDFVAYPIIKFKYLSQLPHQWQVGTYNKKNYQVSWRHLERAHILGQPYPYEHTAVHWKMFCFGIKEKNYKEVIGQMPRLLVGGVKSFVGHIPVGNTGGANVPPLKPMEIPEDIAIIITNTKAK